MLSPMRLQIVRSIFGCLPVSRCFRLKSRLLRWAGAEIGKNLRIYSSVKIFGNGGLVIGDDVFIGHEVFISSSRPATVTIGSRVDIAPQVYLGTGTHLLDSPDRAAGSGTNRDISIGDEAWLGARTMVLPGAVVGKHAMTAAGAVVNGTVGNQEIHGGVPAQKIKSIEPC